MPAGDGLDRVSEWCSVNSPAPFFCEYGCVSRILNHVFYTPPVIGKFFLGALGANQGCCPLYSPALLYAPMTPPVVVADAVMKVSSHGSLIAILFGALSTPYTLLTDPPSALQLHGTLGACLLSALQSPLIQKWGI